MTIRLLLLTLTVTLSQQLFAAGGGHGPALHMTPDMSDQRSLQKGAKTFVNYCMGCHSAKYMRYNRIGQDLGITEDVIKQNLIFSEQKVGETMTTALRPEDGIKYFGVEPPDLSVIARSRGADWIYSYLLTFYRDTSRPFGVNNLTYENASMPHVLWELQGWQYPVYKTVMNADGTETPVVDHLKLSEPGKLSPEEYEKLVYNLVNFLVYVGEPAQIQRKQTGFWVLFYLIVVLLPLTYLMKKEYWKDVH